MSIHRLDCENYRNRSREPEEEGRWVKVSWADEITERYNTSLMLYARDRTGLVMDIATVLNTLNAKVRTLNARDNSGLAQIYITLEVKDLAELHFIINKLSQISGITEVCRNGK